MSHELEQEKLAAERAQRKALEDEWYTAQYSAGVSDGPPEGWAGETLMIDFGEDDGE